MKRFLPCLAFACALPASAQVMDWGYDSIGEMEVADLITMMADDDIPVNEEFAEQELMRRPAADTRQALLDAFDLGDDQQREICFRLLQGSGSGVERGLPSFHELRREGMRNLTRVAPENLRGSVLSISPPLSPAERYELQMLLQDNRVVASAAADVLASDPSFEMTRALARGLFENLKERRSRYGNWRLREETEEGNPYALEVLEEGLRSEQFEVRHLCMSLLAGVPPDKYTPSARLFEVCVEGLRDDGYVNLDASISILLQRPTLGGAALADALDSDDVQQRFVAAFVLAKTHRTMRLERTLQILTTHLASNPSGQDCAMARVALIELGAPGVNAVTALLNSPDEQARTEAARILQAIRTGDDNDRNWIRYDLISLAEDGL